MTTNKYTASTQCAIFHFLAVYFLRGTSRNPACGAKLLRNWSYIFPASLKRHISLYVWHFPHQWHLNELVTSSFPLGSSTGEPCALQSPLTAPPMPSPWLTNEYGSKNCLGKAIPQASQQFLSSFFTSTQWGEGKNLGARPATERYTHLSSGVWSPPSLREECRRKSVGAFHYHLRPFFWKKKQTNKQT